MSFRGRLVSLLLLTNAACVVLGPSEQGSAIPIGPNSTNAGPCQITMVSHQFGGFCGSIDLVNSGTSPMTGWEVEFELPPGAELANGWNGTYEVAGTHVTVTADDPAGLLEPGETVELGFCTDQPPQDLQLVPGICPGRAVVTSPSEPSVAPSRGLSDSLASVDPNRWSIGNGYEAGDARACTYSPARVEAGTDGLRLMVEQPAGQPSTCGALRSRGTFGPGTVSAAIGAAAGDGVVTELSITQKTDKGLQGVAFYIAGAGDQVWAVSYRDGARTEMRISVDLAPLSGLHTYAISEGPKGIVWSIDGTPVARGRDVPDVWGGHITLAAWSSGDANWAGTAAPGSPATFARIAGVAFAP